MPLITNIVNYVLQCPLHNYIVLLKTHLCHSIMGGDKALISLQLFSTEQNASQKRLVFKVTPEIWLLRVT